MEESYKKIFMLTDLLLLLTLAVGYFIMYFTGIAHGEVNVPLLLMSVFGLTSFFSKAAIYTVKGEIGRSVAMYFSSFCFLVAFFVTLVFMVIS
ncbi:hypothetical protein [Halalkalibacter hemicellulosilyticus]|uniref:Uncharacterized protein n=1 Tax=Halalkalibacter hemicellulosilyticusJCM 9152 TaxID=1236971 RepID=W4QIP2_9BACI|nr:hypothetical protein [Halalkalibacter hemicellulosilyticus]GAE31941.1 hypothetical protein JCM9152_3443 [Halalkalibacter hemicellulosilyticusJCM 9152]